MGNTTTEERTGLVAIISLLIVVALSITITRIAAVALTHTGLSREAARFQARSAFTGVGFTTSEAEKVVQHPVRRRIVRLLMLLGNAGLVTAMSTFILGFAADGGGSTLARLLLLAAGVLLLSMVAASRRVDRLVSRLMDRALAKYSDLEVRDYSSLLHLAGDYHVSEMMCESGDWMEDRSLAELRLRDEGLLVLGVTRPDGTYLGAPNGATRIHANDSLLLYGRLDAIERLDRRPMDWSGDEEHERAVAEYEKQKSEERARDPEP